MAKYLFIASYTSEGIKGVTKEGGTARRQAFEKSLAELGGKLECEYFAFGADDVYAIADLPDNSAAAAAAMAVGASGVVNLRTVVLMTAEEMDAAAKKVPAYKGPGQ